MATAQQIIGGYLENAIDSITELKALLDARKYGDEEMQRIKLSASLVAVNIQSLQDKKRIIREELVRNGGALPKTVAGVG